MNEADIIANAGKRFCNYYHKHCRGVDIQLGGKKGSMPEEQLKINKEEIKSLEDYLLLVQKE